MSREWLETDGLGGFASGTVDGERTRRYHALLLAAVTPPTERYVLVNGVEVWFERDGRRWKLTAQQYAPDIRDADDRVRCVAFEWQPWPSWKWRLDDGTEITHELFVERGAPRVTLVWRITAGSGGRLSVRPLLSGRDYHALHHENSAFEFDAEKSGHAVCWRPYPDVPAVTARTNGRYTHDPLWYRGFLYADELDRGFDAVEDLAAPGIFAWDLAPNGESVMILEAHTPGVEGATPRPIEAANEARRIRSAERKRRAAKPTAIERAAESYVVRRGDGLTIVAGYPWFADWGRDTFISLRGLCLATGRLDWARAILLEWAGAVSQGMLPNRFVDSGEEPEYNAVDASLWYIVAVHEYLAAARAAKARVPRIERAALEEATQSILDGYAGGTRYGIHADDDGLLACGVPGVQLTWMDARIGDRVVTPRIGKPVEVQALWWNALRIGSSRNDRWRALENRARSSFEARFWSPEGYLYDVVDVDHQTGVVDDAFRPNQIFAVGGLPFRLLERRHGQRLVDAVEARLWTPLGLRSLDPTHPQYAPRYEGGPVERDGAYHEGTVWPWLAGPFVEAWVRVRGDTHEARQAARQRFLMPLIAHLDAAGLGHVSEIADADPPHTPRGCPFQAWSVGELLRLDRVVLATNALDAAPGASRRVAAR